ncbi:MBG domain-containing protein, partial [Adlercreutzia sp. ZJ138]|uniref:MBG domain-containing protein n=1 Tax=Adlercreutzia sp. ZJ138 TaxID=2709405 RepID=UPI0013EA577F
MFERLIDARNTFEGKFLAVLLSVSLAFSSTNALAFAEVNDEANEGAATGTEQVAEGSGQGTDGSTSAPTNNQPTAPETAPTTQTPATTPAQQPAAQQPATQPDASGSAASDPANAQGGSVRPDEAQVTFQLHDAYVKVEDQELTGTDEVKLTVEAAKELKFSAYANAGYKLTEVKAKNSETDKVPVREEDGVYTIEAAYVNNTLEITVETEADQAEESAVPVEPEAITEDTVIKGEGTDGSEESTADESDDVISGEEITTDNDESDVPEDALASNMAFDAFGGFLPLFGLSQPLASVEDYQDAQEIRIDVDESKRIDDSDARGHILKENQWSIVGENDADIVTLSDYRRTSVKVTGQNEGETILRHDYSYTNVLGKRENVTTYFKIIVGGDVVEKTEIVPVYVMDNGWQGNSDIENLVGLYEKDDWGFYPVGTVELPKSVFKGSSPYLNNLNDWSVVKEALKNTLDTSTVDKNKNNRMIDYIDSIDTSKFGDNASGYTALFDNSGSAGFPDNMRFSYHLDLRMAAYDVDYKLANPDIAGHQQGESLGTRGYFANLEIMKPEQGGDWYLKNIPEGYAIEGYYTDKNCTTTYEFGGQITSNQEVWVKLKRQEITVTWVDYDGTTVLEKDEKVEFGSMPEYNGAIPTRVEDGLYTYEFKGWTPEVGWVTSDITYTAQYTPTPKPVALGYVAIGGGTVSPEGESLVTTSEPNQVAGSIATANVGYEYVGWFSDQSCTQLAEGTTTEITDTEGNVTGYKFAPNKPESGWNNATYYAKFNAKEVPYTVKHYKVNTAQTAATPYKTESFTKPTGETVTANPIDIPGYTYQSAFEKNGMMTVTSGIVVGDGSLVLNLYYTPNTDSLVYDRNGGSGEMAPSEGFVDGAVYVDANKFVYEGFIFAGWNTQADGKGTSYSAGDQFTLTSENDVLYATWIPIPSASVSIKSWVYDGTEAGSDSHPLTVSPEITDNRIGEASTEYFMQAENGKWIPFVAGAAPTNVGTYKVEATWPGVEGVSVGFTKECEFKITPAPVTVTAEAKSKVYGTADPELTANVDGTLGTDTVAYTLSRESGEDAGSYTITPDGDVNQGNYAVTFNTGTLTIEPKGVATQDMTVDTLANVAYNGSEQKQEPVVKNGNTT